MLATSGLVGRVGAALPFLPNASAAKLAVLLGELDPAAGLDARVEWVEHWILWVRTTGVGELPADAPVASGAPGAALWAFVHLLERDRELATRVADQIRSILADGTLVSLLCQAGLARDPRLLGEVVQRLLRHAMPAAPDDHDLGVMVERLFSSRASAVWLEQAPPLTILALFQTLTETEHGPSLRRRLLEDASHGPGVRRTFRLPSPPGDRAGKGGFGR